MSTTWRVPTRSDDTYHPHAADRAVGPQVLAPRSAEPEGEAREVSVLMADLRGFTPFCECATPCQTAVVLDQYLTAMSRVVRRAHGRIQDFFGDGILCVFGAPGHDPDHAWHAVSSALEMQAAIRLLSSRWKLEVGTGFRLGVAVHTGEVYAGAVGPPRQRKYAVVGDAVNTVARLEDLNRRLETTIVMSGNTRSRLEDRVATISRGSFVIRGRNRPVDVFEVLGVAHLLAPTAGSSRPGSLA